MTDLADQITLRPEAKSDHEMMYRCYRHVRTPELQNAGFPEEHADEFLRSQYDAQQASYKYESPDAEYCVIQLKGRPVGRHYLDRSLGTLRVMDLMVLPEFADKGIEQHLIRELMDESRRTGEMVEAWVEEFRGTDKAYLDLGFTYIEGDEVHQRLGWPAEAAAKAKEEADAREEAP